MPQTPKKSFYFLGIAGAGTSALASILISEGHRVTGSDAGVFPPVSTYLDKLGIRYYQDFAAGHVPADTDAAIIGTTAKISPADNPEYAEIIRRKIPHYTFAEFLGQYTRQRENLVITGSFGKSTLTALLTFIMKQAGRDPGYFIGAVPLDLDRTGAAGTDSTFLIEGDEYIVSHEKRQAKFLFYNPNHVLISSLVHDHVNVFPTMESYEAPFAELIGMIPPEGKLVCARQYEPLHRLSRGRPVVWYGLEKGEGYYAEDLHIGEQSRFTLVTPAGARIDLQTQLLGMHNVENIVGAAAFLLELDLVTPAELQRAIPLFRGVERRLDRKTTVSKVPVYEGFGSSLEKARSAIDAILLHFPDRRTVVVFEPHTFSWRNHEALEWYDSVFKGVGRVLMLPPPTHGAGTHQQLTQDDIIARVGAAGVDVVPVSGAADVMERLSAEIRPDDIVLLLSSGPLDGLPALLPPVFDARYG